MYQARHTYVLQSILQGYMYFIWWKYAYICNQGFQQLQATRAIQYDVLYTRYLVRCIYVFTFADYTTYTGTCFVWMPYGLRIIQGLIMYVQQDVQPRRRPNMSGNCISLQDEQSARTLGVLDVDEFIHYERTVKDTHTLVTLSRLLTDSGLLIIIVPDTGTW